MTTRILLRDERRIGGIAYAAGSTVYAPDDVAASLIGAGLASRMEEESAPSIAPVVGVVDSDGRSIGVLNQRGELIPGARRVGMHLGKVVADLVAVSGMPPLASFSGAGSYGSAGTVAVQSTGTLVHNPIGWFDGSPCLEFTPNTDSNAEVRFYLGANTIDLFDANGVAWEFELPAPDTTKQNFVVDFDYSNDAANLFPSNYGTVAVFRNDATSRATDKEFAGRKYIRQRWDYDNTAANAGAWPGYNQAVGGSGASYQKSVSWFRFRFSKFNGKTIKLKRVRRGGCSTPCLVLGTDAGGYRAGMDEMLSYATKVNVRGYGALYWSELSAATDSRALYEALYQAGWDITGDDVEDRPLGDTLTDLAALRAAVRGTRENQVRAGWLRGLPVWVANNNNSSHLMERVLREAGYVCNRNGTFDGLFCFPEGGMPNALRTPSDSIDNKKLSDVQPYIDRAITYGATLWLYWHGVFSKARIDADRTNNVTGTSGAPIAVNAGETMSAYRARAAGLGTGAGNATVTYFDARIGSSALGIWFEDWKEIIDYAVTKRSAGALQILTPTEWCAEVGLL